MAALTDPRGFRIEVDWSPADGVITPEFAATWCRLFIWVGDRCVTTVDAVDSGIRRSIYTSAYPLAEWIAYNWWPLVSEVRPSAVATQNWTWSQVRSNDWLRRHNVRSAGNGMSWPDLTLVPEGSVTGIAWHAGAGMSGQPVRFMESGFAHVRSDEVERELRRFVHQVLDRLNDVGLKSRLEDEWATVTGADEGEAAFTRAAARLGLDPYSLSESVADDIIAIAEELEPEMFEEFVDTADPESLPTAFQWLNQARDLSTPIPALTSIVELRQGLHLRDDSRPHARGYEMAQLLRNELGLRATDQIDLTGLVSKAVLEKPSGGLEGLVRADDSVALVLPSSEMSQTSIRFAQGRGLGLALAGQRHEYLLDPAGTDVMKQSRAFAAELLAPAAGVSAYLAELPASTDAAFEAIARRFGASASLVRWQYENQISRES
ncbi:MAG: hypothetical protein JWQ32_2215 [Marmoricola sp.]|nr:hypothetical protein [Marmoricola sp.]